MSRLIGTAASLCVCALLIGCNSDPEAARAERLSALRELFAGNRLLEFTRSGERSTAEVALPGGLLRVEILGAPRGVPSAAQTWRVRMQDIVQFEGMSSEQQLVPIPRDRVPEHLLDPASRAICGTRKLLSTATHRIGEYSAPVLSLGIDVELFDGDVSAISSNLQSGTSTSGTAAGTGTGSSCGGAAWTQDPWSGSRLRCNGYCPPLSHPYWDPNRDYAYCDQFISEYALYLFPPFVDQAGWYYRESCGCRWGHRGGTLS